MTEARTSTNIRRMLLGDCRAAQIPVWQGSGLFCTDVRSTYCVGSSSAVRDMFKPEFISGVKVCPSPSPSPEEGKPKRGCHPAVLLSCQGDSSSLSESERQKTQATQGSTDVLPRSAHILVWHWLIRKWTLGLVLPVVRLESTRRVIPN